MTCRSKRFVPTDLTFIVNGKAFKQWKLTLRDVVAQEDIPVVGNLQGGDFHMGHLTDIAIARIVETTHNYLKATMPRVSMELDDDVLTNRLKRF